MQYAAIARLGAELRAQQKDGLVTYSSPTRWVPQRAPVSLPAWQEVPLFSALRRGLACRCPSCGAGKIFQGYLRVFSRCEVCEAPLGQARADDVPPYFTILIVGHLIVPSMLIWERLAAPALWLQGMVWVPLTFLLTLVLLRPIKGATVGVTLKLGLLRPEDAP